MPDVDRSLYANTVSVVDYQACLDEANPKANPNESLKEFCVRAPKYEDYIINDFVSEIDSNFRTLKGRESRAVSDESAGGKGALSLALRIPEIFLSAASHSGIVALL